MVLCLFYSCRSVGIQFYIGMVAPVVLIYVFNFILFVIIIISVLCKERYKHAGKSEKSGVSARQQLMIVITLSVLCGISWGIGLLATDQIGSRVAQKIFATVFVILTSFHGLFIFILHCARSKDARREWGRWFYKVTKKDFSDITTSTIGYVQLHLKRLSLQPLSPSTPSADGNFELPVSTLPPIISKADNVVNVTNQCESDTTKMGELNTSCNLQSMEGVACEESLKSEQYKDSLKLI